MDDVLTTAEAVERFGRGHVRHQIARRMWQRPERGVVVLHNGPLTVEQKDLVALAAAPPGSALAAATALTYDGFEGFADVRRHLVVPAGSRRPSEADDIHWSEFLDDRDVHPLRRPRRTRPARSLVDLASWCGNDRYARSAIIAGIQQGLVNTRQLRDALTRRGTCWRRALVVESLHDAGGGIQSLPERDFDEICAELGLPPRTRQHPVRGKDGRYFLDVHIEQLGLSIEIHGIPHMAVVRWNHDLVRANEVVIAGDRLLIFSSYAIRHERPTVVDQLRRMVAHVRRAA
jgi:hypothetical protein